MKYILILFLLLDTRAAVSVTTQEFDREETCELALRMVSLRHTGDPNELGKLATERQSKSFGVCVLK